MLIPARLIYGKLYGLMLTVVGREILGIARKKQLREVALRTREQRRADHGDAAELCRNALRLDGFMSITEGPDWPLWLMK
jgi:hypothetical protein